METRVGCPGFQYRLVQVGQERANAACGPEIRGVRDCVSFTGFGRSENFLEGDELRRGSLACSDAFKDFRLRLDEAAAGEVGEALVLFLISSTFSLVRTPGEKHPMGSASQVRWHGRATGR